MKLIVGLGNPGKQYERTRHNAGFLAVDSLATEHEATWKKDVPRQSLVAKVRIGDTSCLLAKPQTFMNLSGEAVHALVSYYKVAPEDILIVQDELDLAPGKMAFLQRGGSAGHNGIISVQHHLNTQQIMRLRIGVGRPPAEQATEDWVLGKMESATHKVATTQAPKAIVDWIEHGGEKAMNAWNRA